MDTCPHACGVTASHLGKRPSSIRPLALLYPLAGFSVTMSGWGRCFRLRERRGPLAVSRKPSLSSFHVLWSLAELSARPSSACRQ